MMLLLAATPMQHAPEKPALKMDASVYAVRYDKRRTASGLPYIHTELSCASNKHPLGALLRVSRGKEHVLVRVTDRLHPKFSHRVDLSGEAMRRLSGGAYKMTDKTATVLRGCTVVRWGEDDAKEWLANALKKDR